MRLWTKLRNTLRAAQVDDDIADELRSHFDEATAEGRPPVETLRAFGNALLIHESAREALIATSTRPSL